MPWQPRSGMSWRWERCIGTLALVSLLSGCDTPECQEQACAATEVEAGAGDYRVELAAGSVVSLTLDRESGLSVVGGGEIIMAPNGSDWCGTNPCSITLKQFRVELQPIDVDTSAGRFTLEDVALSLETPVKLTAQGTDYVLPEDALVHACLEVDGRKDGGTVAANDAGLFRGSFVDQHFHFEGTLPFVFQLQGDRCEPFRASVSGTFGTLSPWAQVPEAG
jgi:hypothetical protein